MLDGLEDNRMLVEYLEKACPGWINIGDELSAHIVPEAEQIVHMNHSLCICSPTLSVSDDEIDVWLHYEIGKIEDEKAALEKEKDGLN